MLRAVLETIFWFIVCQVASIASDNSAVQLKTGNAIRLCKVLRLCLYGASHWDRLAYRVNEEKVLTKTSKGRFL